MGVDQADESGASRALPSNSAALSLNIIRVELRRVKERRLQSATQQLDFKANIERKLRR